MGPTEGWDPTRYVVALSNGQPPLGSGFSWVFPKTVKEALLSWKGSFIGKKKRNMWKSVPPCIFWTVWKERNRIGFRDGTVNLQKLKHSFVYNLWSWNSLYMGEEISSLIGFLEWVAAS